MKCEICQYEFSRGDRCPECGSHSRTALLRLAHASCANAARMKAALGAAMLAAGTLQLQVGDESRRLPRAVSSMVVMLLREGELLDSGLGLAIVAAVVALVLIPVYLYFVCSRWRVGALIVVSMMAALTPVLILAVCPGSFFPETLCVYGGAWLFAAMLFYRWMNESMTARHEQEAAEAFTRRRESAAVADTKPDSSA